MKALLVDDEGLTREGLALLIQVVNPDVEVTSVGTSADALNCLTRDSYDFVFLDVQLDGESGLDLLDRLKELDVDTPVIMLSSHDGRDTIMDALARGAFGFLPKQSDNTAVIRQAMDLALRGGVYLPPSVRARRGVSPPASPAAASRPIQVAEVGPSDLKLSPRVYEALYYVSQGLTNKSIARKMGISDNVVAEYVRDAFQQLNVAGRAGFMVLLNKRGWQMAKPRNVKEN